MIDEVFQVRWLHFLKKGFYYIFFTLIFINIVLAGQQGTEENLKVLILTGGHGFERSQFFQMFDSFEAVEFTEVQHPWANFSYDPNIAERFEVFVFYDMVQNITSGQKEAFVKLLKEGKGMVFLHHSLASYQEWGEFRNIIGGQYYLESITEGGKTIPKSTYQHDVEMLVKIVEPNHPVTLGLMDFVIFDEVYGGFFVSNNVKPLLTTNHPQSGKIIGWTHNYGKSRIVYIQLGHDHHSYENENFRKLIYQAIKFAAQPNK